MRMPVIKSELHIQAPIEVCFDLARSIDIHAESTSQTKEKPIGGVTSGLIELGQTVTWEAVHFGIRQRLTAKITEMQRPYYFVDEMVAGAFKRFRHKHSFSAADNGTWMMDEFDYDAPMGLMGKMADKLFLKRYMRSFLVKRNRYIKMVAEQGNISRGVNAMSQISICKLDSLIHTDISHLVAESSKEGFRHMKRLVDEYENGTNRFDKRGEALFMAYDHERIIGIGRQEVFHAHLHVIPRYVDEPLAGKGIRYWLKQPDNIRSDIK
jgi:ligand-binding SRPBCC domain-containing protein